MATNEETEHKRPSPLLIAAAIVALVVLVAVGRFCSSAATIDVTVNGTPLTLHGAKTIETAIRESGLPINPGDFISIRGTILERTAGYPLYATVNGNETADPNYRLREGDDIVIADGKDIVEGYDTAEDVTPHGAIISGAGAIRSITPGVDGKIEIRTGKVSGETVVRQISETTDAVCTKYNPEVGDDMVLALTFDWGPSEEYTGQILDILKDNDARATFFCVGIEIEKYNDDLIQRERSEGHQVCTNTYDRARSSEDGAVASLEPDQMVDEVEHGRSVIAQALNGVEEVSRIVRLPGNKLTEEMVAALDDHVEAEVGWNTDTGDWLDNDNDEVYDVLMHVEPGDIVLLHDGGGDRTRTINALRAALPLLKGQGYSFVTIDDLMKYPPQQ